MPTSDPNSCATIAEARDEIDRIDRKLLALLQRRHLFGERLAELRAGDLPANIPELFLEFMRDRRAWGTKLGVEPEFVERVFSVIAQRFYDRRVQDAVERQRRPAQIG
jgi:isochorismate pyruvate lyase